MPVARAKSVGETRSLQLKQGSDEAPLKGLVPESLAPRGVCGPTSSNADSGS